MFFSNLTKICKEQNLKLTPLLTELNLSTGNISKWRNGTLPTGEILIKLSNRLNVSVDYLLGRTNCPDVLISDENNNIHVIVPTKSKLQKVEESAVNYFDTSTEESKKCLKKFNKLSPNLQKFVIEQIDNLLKVQENNIAITQNIVEKHEEYAEKVL